MIKPEEHTACTRYQGNTPLIVKEYYKEIFLSKEGDKQTLGNFCSVKT